ncbi:hypothetical protein WDU94_007889 [Cyamophila willieti]
MLLHFMPEEECYNSLTSLVSCKHRTFVTQTKLLYEVTWRTVMHISKKHVKSASAHLTRHRQGSRVEKIYTDWVWWILQGLPFNHLVRVLDCYLHEGIKVLYRVAMSILLLFHKFSSSNNSDWMREISDHGVEAALTKFCRQMPVSPRKLLKVAFGIRALGSTYIQRVFIKTEMTLKSKSVITGSKQLVRSRSSENLPTSQSQHNIQMMSHTLTIRELFTLWSWLPVRITMYQPVLLYTTEEHGCSLTTFYYRVEQHEPTLLMIKTTNNEVSEIEQHGCSLTTFYYRVEQHEPTLLMIKTTNNEVSEIEQHGCSLTTFYYRVEQHEPTLLMIKTTNNEVSEIEQHGCSLTTFYYRVEQHEPTLLMIKTTNNEVSEIEQHGCSLTTFYYRVEQHEPTLLMIKTTNNEVSEIEQHGCSLTTFYYRVEQHEPTLLMIKTTNNEVSEIEQHGCSLTTFYYRVEQHEPTLLMIKTTNNEVSEIEQHGCSLTTFYYRVEQHEPTLLMIKTTNNEVSEIEQHGCSLTTFYYRVEQHEPTLLMIKTTNNEETQVLHSNELFMAADQKMITIGGGDGQAIWMDENIRYGKTDKCSTFNNPPLCAGGDFEIRVLEVYGFGTT